MADYTPVVILSVDSLRADRFTEECFPESMAILESDFAHFASAYSHGNATPLAFPGIITGHPPTADGRLPPDAPTLAELVGGRASGFSNNPHLTASQGYGQGFAAFHDLHVPDQPSVVGRLRAVDALRESAAVVWAYQALKKMRALLDGDASTGPEKRSGAAETVTGFVHRRLAARDDFVWGHYMDPHRPYTPSMAVDGPEIDRPAEEIMAINDGSHAHDPLPPEDMRFLEALYEGNIRRFDRELARLLRWMGAQAWYDDALIIVVSDHGDLFGEHGAMFHPPDVDPVDELIQTPLLVKYPGGTHAGQTFDHRVQHADIIRTVAEVAGGDTHPSLPDGPALTDSCDRQIVSASDVAVRVTEPDGVGVRRRDGTTDAVDDLSERGRSLLASATIPTIRLDDDGDSGTDDATQDSMHAEREQRLEALGYR